MQQNPKSRLIWQIVVFVVVFVAAFLATKYLGNHLLNASKEKPAIERSTNN